MAAPPKWDPIASDDAAAEKLAAALNVAPIVARLLCQRGYSDPELAARFLNPSLDHLHDPMMLADMPIAVERILAAIARKERIAIHGDYDVDGVTSTVILRRALELLGADVVHFIPERLKDGYGLQPAALERLHADGVALVDFGRLRHSRCGGGATRTRTGRRPDHHRPPRARHGAARCAGGHQPKASRLHLPGQAPGGRRCGAEAGAGALSDAVGTTAGCPDSSRSPRLARWPTSFRSSARTA